MTLVQVTLAYSLIFSAGKKMTWMCIKEYCFMEKIITLKRSSPEFSAPPAVDFLEKGQT
jgi:hypothetical protein